MPTQFRKITENSLKKSDSLRLIAFNKQEAEEISVSAGGLPCHYSALFPQVPLLLLQPEEPF